MATALTWFDSFESFFQSLVCAFHYASSSSSSSFFVPPDALSDAFHQEVDLFVNDFYACSRVTTNGLISSSLESLGSLFNQVCKCSILLTCKVAEPLLFLMSWSSRTRNLSLVSMGVVAV